MEPSPPPAPAPARRLPRSPRGQATVDYAALLALVAVALAAAGAVTGLASVPARIVHAVRVGICIVGGDVCRNADALADGLAPCVVAEKAEGSGLTVSVAILRLGHKGEWSAARRSDGTVLITHSHDRRVGATTGAGFAIGKVQVGAFGSLDLASTSGSAWELPSVAAAARFVADVRAGRATPPATWRFGDIGEEAAGSVGLTGIEVWLTGVAASWRAAAGMRVGRGQRTIFIHAGVALSDALDLLPTGFPGRGTSTAPAGGRTGPLLLSVTRDASGLRELAIRRVTSGARAHEMVETLGRLDLRDPTNRALAARLVRVRLPWAPAVAADLRAVARRIVEVGTIERSVYAVEDHSHDFTVGVRLGAMLGVETASVDVARRLVSASAWTHGSPERRRVDCVGDGGAAPA